MPNSYPAPTLMPHELRRVVIASAVGNIIEWYDFYVFGSVASIVETRGMKIWGATATASAGSP